MFIYDGTNSGPFISNFSDTLGNTWLSGTDTTNHQADFSSTLATGGSADTFTVNWTASVNDAVVSLEISGQNASPLDGTVQVGSTSGTAWNCPSITTTNANDMIVCCASDSNHNNAFTAGTGFTIPFGNFAGGNTPSGACEVEIVTVAGTYTPTFTVGTSASGKAMTVAIKSS